MALFKILKGDSNNLVSYDNAEVVNGKIPFPALGSGKTLFTTVDSTPIIEGYAYFTEDTHKFYIDTKDKRLNLYTDHADYATYDENGRNLAELSEVSYENIDDTGGQIGVININGIEYPITCPADIAGKTINKYTFDVSADQTVFTIPFNFSDSSTLTLYYNGIMIQEAENYTINGNTITLNGWKGKQGDFLTVMGIEGAAGINVDEDIIRIQTELNEALEKINSSTENLIYKNKSNIMTADGRIIMDSSYVPTADMELATKKYVDNATPPTVGTTTDYSIYIGSTQPASGTAPLVWIDTTAKTGTFKYRTSTTGTWTPVPVAWI